MGVLVCPRFKSDARHINPLPMGTRMVRHWLAAK